MQELVIYYVVLVSGIPEAVSSILSRAQAYQRELTSKNREAVIVPCTPLETLCDEPGHGNICKCFEGT